MLLLTRPLNENPQESPIGHIKPYSKTNYCFYIGAQKLNRIAYKYMDLETAMLCVKNGTIRFAQPDTWADKYEGRFYNAIYSNVTKDRKLTPKLYACCITFTSVSEAAWNTYTYNKSGIGSRCVQFKFDRTKFRKYLDQFATHNKVAKYDIYEGSVTYDLSDFQIDNLHLKSSDLYPTYFNNFGFNNYINLMLIKRPAFKYEEEHRFFCVPRDQKHMKEHIDIPISWKDVIREIRVDERCSDVEIEAFITFCEKYGISKDIIIKLDLHTNPQPNIVIE